MRAKRTTRTETETETKTVRIEEADCPLCEQRVPVENIVRFAPDSDNPDLRVEFCIHCTQALFEVDPEDAERLADETSNEGAATPSTVHALMPSKQAVFVTALSLVGVGYLGQQFVAGLTISKFALAVAGFVSAAVIGLAAITITGAGIMIGAQQ